MKSEEVPKKSENVDATNYREFAQKVIREIR